MSPFRFHDRETQNWLAQLRETSDEDSTHLPESEQILRRLMIGHPVTRVDLQAMGHIHRQAALHLLWPDLVVNEQAPPRVTTPPSIARISPVPVPSSSGDATIESDPRNRRREPRVAFSTPVSVKVLSPRFRLDSAILQGTTNDINANGVKIMFPGVSTSLFEMWKKGIAEDFPISVTIEFDEFDEAPKLFGDVVWTNVEADEEGGEPVGSAGVLLSVLAPAEKKRYDDFLMAQAGSEEV